jgi:hypothetical protein
MRSPLSIRIQPITQVIDRVFGGAEIYALVNLLEALGMQFSVFGSAIAPQSSD